jgi:hypothetical protein
MKSRTLLSVFFTGLLAVGLAVPGIVAAGITRDAGVELNLELPYENKQVITDISNGSAIYGKLLGTTPVDIYKVRVSEDTEQVVSLVAPAGEVQGDSLPSLLLIDRTDDTQPSGLRIPLPDPQDEYHAAQIKPVEGTVILTEPFLLGQFQKVAEQRISFKKDLDYYLVVLDSGETSKIIDYTIRFGDRATWTAGSTLQNFGTWIAVKANAYGGMNAFTFTVEHFGAVLFVLAFAVLLGLFIIQSIFDFSAGRSKAAAFLSIKLQPFARWITWISLWFLLIGGYIFSGKLSWTGQIFAMTFPVIALLIMSLIQSFKIAPQLMAIEVQKSEASVPMTLRKKQFVLFVLQTLNFAGAIALLSTFLVS